MVVIASEAAHDLFTYTALDYSFAHWLKGQYDILCYLLSHGISTPFDDEIFQYFFCKFKLRPDAFIVA